MAGWLRGTNMVVLSDQFIELFTGRPGTIGRLTCGNGKIGLLRGAGRGSYRLPRLRMRFVQLSLHLSILQLPSTRQLKRIEHASEPGKQGYHEHGHYDPIKFEARPDHV